MPYQSGPRPRAVELVEGAGGSIWTTCTDMASSSGALARTTIENYVVPDKAKMLLGWRPIAYPCDQAVDESLLIVFDIRGQNFNFQPEEVICGNVAPAIMADGGGMLHAPSEYYDVFAPCAGGELWDVGCEPCDAIVGLSRVGVEFTWTDKRIALPLIRSICSREDAITAATAGIIAGTTLTLNFAHKLIEVGGCFVPTAHTVEEEANLTLIAMSEALKINEIKIMLDPSGALANLAADEGAVLTYVARRAYRLPFSQETCTIETDWDVDVAQTNAAQAVSMFRYV